MKNYIIITGKIIDYNNICPIIPKLVSEYIKVVSDDNIIFFNENNCRFDSHGPKNDEMKTIYYLREKLKWNIHIVRRINEDGISTPDIRRLEGYFEYWDIKNIYESKTSNSRKSKIKHRITKQCNNFIFDYRNIFSDLTNLEAISQVKQIYNDVRYRHVNMILLLGKNNFIRCYKRK